MLLPYLENKLFRVRRWASDSNQMTKEENTIEPALRLDDADIISSEQIYAQLGIDDDNQLVTNPPLHTPVLDIDVPAALVPSSTPGKHHLYLDVPMTWEQYVKLLDVMAEVGILEHGYVDASKARGFTAVRLPWVRK